MNDTTRHDSEADNTHSPDNSKRNRALLIVTLLVIIGAIIAAMYWYWHRNLESTDDAFIQANVVRLAPRVSGTVTRVLVHDNDHVHKGDLLVELDPTDFKAALAHARANLAAARASYQSSQSKTQLTRATGSADIDAARAALASARAQAKNARTNLKRYKALYAKDEIAQQRLDTAQTRADTANSAVQQAKARLAQARTAPQKLAARQSQARSADARIKQAKAALQQAQLKLSYTRIRAPQDGKITKKDVLPGSQVAAGQNMLSIVSEQPWVVANFKETQITHMHAGQPVTITVDAYPGKTFHGHVDSIQSGTGSAFSLLPPQNATGNFVKVVQRIPVKIVFDNLPANHPILAPGMSVVPTVNIARGATNQHGTD